MIKEKTKNKNAETVAQIVGEATARQTAMTRLDMLEATINTDFVEYIKKTYPQLTHNDILILGHEDTCKRNGNSLRNINRKSSESTLQTA